MQPTSGATAAAGVDGLLREAGARHEAGRATEALRLCEEALRADPGNLHALELAGVLYARTGAHDRAVRTLERAVSLAPHAPGTGRNLALALRAAGRLEDALEAHRRVAALVPDAAEAHNDLGMTLRRLGRLAEAEAAYRRALAIAPEYADAHANLGNVLQLQDRTEEACAAYRRSLAIAADRAGVHRSLGNALQRLGRHREAIASYRAAIAADPDDAQTHSDLGSALVEAGDPQAGAEALRAALRRAPGSARVHSNLGLALHELGDLERALASYDRSLALEPGNTHALAYRAVALGQLGRGADLACLVDYERLVRIVRPAPPEGHESIEAFNAALAEFALEEWRGTREGARRPGQTRELVAEGRGPMRALEAFVRREVEAYARALPAGESHPFVRRRPQRFRVIGWANVIDSGENTTHIHPHAWLSAVYYVRTAPLRDVAGDRPGWLEFGRPDPRLDDGVERHRRAIEPEEGALVLFPSFFWHHIRPFEAHAHRISYAFDVLPAPVTRGG